MNTPFSTTIPITIPPGTDRNFPEYPPTTLSSSGTLVEASLPLWGKSDIGAVIWASGQLKQILAIVSPTQVVISSPFSTDLNKETFQTLTPGNYLINISCISADSTLNVVDKGAILPENTTQEIRCSCMAITPNGSTTFGNYESL